MSRPIGILAVALALVLSATSSGQVPPNPAVLKEPPLEKLEDDDLNKPYYREGAKLDEDREKYKFLGMYVRLLRLDRELAERQIQSSGRLLGDKRKDLERDYKAMPNPQELSEKVWMMARNC